MRGSWGNALCRAPRNSLACCIRSPGQWGPIKTCRQGVIELGFCSGLRVETGYR